MQHGSAAMENNFPVTQKLNTEVPHDPDSLLLGFLKISRRTAKGYLHICMFLIFTKAKRWKQAKCQLADESIQSRPVHSVEYYSATKVNEMLIYFI